MKMRTHIVATMLGLAACLPSVCQAKVEYLKEEPPKGAIPLGKIVYVDDGTCPSGEVKEITGVVCSDPFRAKFAASSAPTEHRECQRSACDSRPNHALNRTGRYVASTWQASARPAG